MRPENPTHQDLIQPVLDKSWEHPPAHLEQQLMAIPKAHSRIPSRSPDPYAHILSTILMLWGLGMAAYLWKPVAKIIESLSQNLLGYISLSPALFSHPIISAIMLVVLLGGWAWVDLEKRPKAT